MASNAPETGGEFLFGKAPSSEIKSAGLFTPQQSQLFQQLVARLSGARAPNILSIAGLEDYTRRLAAGGPTAEDTAYLSEGVDKPLIRGFKEDILPQISRDYGGANSFYGSERIRTEERATRELMDTLARTRSGYLANQQQSRSQNLLQGLIGKGQLEQQSQMAPLALLAQILGIPQLENIGFQHEGTEGLMQGLFQSLGTAGGVAGGIGLAKISDERMKEHIEPIKNALEGLRKLKGVKWSWNEKMRKYVADAGGHLPDNHVGVLAQDVEKQFPELVKSYGHALPGEDDVKHVDYNGLIGVAIEAIKELAEKMEVA